MGFGDLNVSMQMRDTITKLVETTVDRLRPKYRYGTVTALDGTSKATVIFVGETNPIIVNLGSVIPMVGSTVRVEGMGTDRYVADVIGGKTTGLPVPSTITSLDSMVTPGRWTIDTAAAAAALNNWPGQGIPTAYTADANNAAGSYCSANVGELEVKVTPTRIIQKATLLLNSAGSGFRGVAVLRRFRSADGVTWMKWEADRQSWSTISTVGQFRAAQWLNANSENIIEVSRTEYRPPYAVRCKDSAGVVWWNPQDRLMQVSPAWNDATLNSPWVPYNTPSTPPNYATAQYLRTEAGIIVVRGLVKSGAANSVIFNLPAGFRPAAQSVFLGTDTSGGGGGYLAVQPNGDVYWRGNLSNSSAWVNLEGITFPAADVAPNSAWTPLTMNTSAGWSTYAGGFPDPACWQDMYGRVWFRGLAKRALGNPAGNSVIASFPMAYVPNQQIHQAVFASGSGWYASLHYGNKTGAGGIARNDIVWMPESPASSTAYVNLGDIVMFPIAVFPEASWANMTLVVGGYYDTANYPPGSIIRIPDGLIHARGLLTGISSGQTFSAPMGVGDRTSGHQMIFSTSSNSSMNRISYGPGHQLGKLGGNGAWISLDGIRYINEG